MYEDFEKLIRGYDADESCNRDNCDNLLYDEDYLEILHMNLTDDELEKLIDENH